MSCKNCKSKRTANITAKCSDMCFVSIGSKEKDGYVPGDMNIGGGDYVEIELCLDCGMVQGKFPLKPTALERGDDED